MKAGTLVVVALALAACAGASQRGRAPAGPESTEMWESQVLDEGPREVPRRLAPPGRATPGANLDGWLNTMPGGVSPALPDDMPGAFEGLPPGGSGAAPGTRSVPPSQWEGPDAQRPHDPLLRR
ncbi:hypothetical protein [Chondromyces crocatus]|uniref:hypothetical protein n=1 Tax=Chondromyces crocatus TaxID=52 RepID=UPI0012E20E30|nr:hypothetical protein [Chondromyces crocatus]